MSEIILTDQNFEKEVLQSKGVVLVDFYADWCGPCRVLSPIIVELANDYKGKNVKVGKMNVDQNQQTPPQYQVMSIPNIVIFKNGKMKNQIIGLQDKEVYRTEIDALLQ